MNYFENISVFKDLMKCKKLYILQIIERKNEKLVNVTKKEMSDLKIETEKMLQCLMMKLKLKRQRK